MQCYLIKRLKDNGNKAKTKRAMASVIAVARFRNTQPPRGLKEMKSRWHSSRLGIEIHKKFTLSIPVRDSVWPATIFPKAPLWSRLDLVFDWLKYRFLLQGHVAQPRIRWWWRPIAIQSPFAATCPKKFNKLDSFRMLRRQIFLKIHVARVKK